MEQFGPLILITFAAASEERVGPRKQRIGVEFAAEHESKIKIQPDGTTVSKAITFRSFDPELDDVADAGLTDDIAVSGAELP